MLTQRLLAVVIVLAAALFVVGVTRERSSQDNHAEKSAASTSAEASEGSVEGEAHASKGDGERDRVLGVDAESTPLVTLAVVLSLALALGVWLGVGGSTLLAVVAVGMLAFAVLDVRELVHQLDENRDGIAAIAAVVAVLHLGAVALAGSLRGAPA